MPSRIDDSHQPYKRTRKLGPGPKRHPPVLQAKDWECHKGKKPYEQICVWVGGVPRVGEEESRESAAQGPHRVVSLSSDEEREVQMS